MASPRRAARLFVAAALAGAALTCGRDEATAPNSGPAKGDLAVTAGPAAVIRFNRQPPTTALDREVWSPTTQPVVVVKDAAGLAVAGAVVTVRVATGPGILQGTLTVTTKSNGSATF